MGQGGDLGHDLSEGVSLSGGVGEVAAQPVVLDGGGVVGRGPHQVGGSRQGDGGGGHGHGGSAAKSDQGGEEQEGLKCGSFDDLVHL